MIPFTLVLPNGRTVASGEVKGDRSLYFGSIDLTAAPPDLSELFAEYSALVNQQCFSLVDAAEDRILAVGLRVRLRDEPPVPVYDLQIYPEERGVSFRLVDHPGGAALPAANLQGTLTDARYQDR